MNAGQLIALLKQVPASTLVLLSSDEEGNSFRAVGQASKEPMADDGRGNFEFQEGKYEFLVLWPK
jgi:hypothetical protein